MKVIAVTLAIVAAVGIGAYALLKSKGTAPAPTPNKQNPVSKPTYQQFLTTDNVNALITGAKQIF